MILAWDNQKGTFLTHFVNFGHEGAPNVTKLTYNMKILWENSHRKKNWGSFVHRGLRYDFLRKKYGPFHWFSSTYVYQISITNNIWFKCKILESRLDYWQLSRSKDEACRDNSEFAPESNLSLLNLHHSESQRSKKEKYVYCIEEEGTGLSKAKRCSINRPKQIFPTQPISMGKVRIKTNKC